MMETEDKFLNAAKRALDDAEKNLDASTVTRLRAARREAIEQGLRRPSRMRPGWLLPVGGFATAAIVFAVAGLLWFSAPNPYVSTGQKALATTPRTVSLSPQQTIRPRRGTRFTRRRNWSSMAARSA